MRVDTPSFEAFNKSHSKEPSYVVEISFDAANTDLHYLTSRPVSGLTGNVLNHTLKMVSSTSQRLNPDKARSTIGSMKFTALDFGLTDLQRSKLQAGAGLKNKRVRFFYGSRDADWSDFVEIGTQRIYPAISYKNGVYTFECADILRALRKQIFKVKETALSASIGASDDELPVFFTEGFQVVQQPSSPSGITDAPGQKVGYLTHEVDGKIEVIRYTGKTSTSFTGCTRGVFGTKPLAVEVDPEDGADEAPKLKEFVYLEMPAPMLAYALLTGSIYGYPGEYLPDHWHLAIGPGEIKTSDFLNIGSDLWDISNNDAGFPAVVKGIEDQDGKKFIEEQLFLLMGVFPRIYNNGELGVRRMHNISPKGGYDRLITADNMVSYGELKQDQSAVVNTIEFEWNYVISRQAFTRVNGLIDPQSIQRHGESTPLQLKLRTLETSRHSYTAIKNRFDVLRDMYAGPPLLLSLVLTPDQNDIETGDILRVKAPFIKDATQDGDGLDRNFLVTNVKTNWRTGNVSVSLFASSQEASAVPPADTTTPIESSFYASEGTEINATNFPGAVSSSNGVTTINANIQLPGADNVHDSSAIYYVNEDLTILAGVVAEWTKNIQLRVNGFLQINGELSGRGNGHAGGVGASRINEGPYPEASVPRTRDIAIYDPECFGETGFIDPTMAPQTGGMLVNTDFIMELSRPVRQGAQSTAPVLALELTDNGLQGLPTDLQGSGGIGGGTLHTYTTGSQAATRTLSFVREGSDAGNGGGGAAIICKGFDFGANGRVDSSGSESGVPESAADPKDNESPEDWPYKYDYSKPSIEGYAGAGTGGAAGAVYYILDGATSVPGTMDSSNSHAFHGESQNFENVTTDRYPTTEFGKLVQGVLIHGPRTPTNEASSDITALPVHENAYLGLHRVQFVTGYIAPDDDTSGYVETDPTFSLTEQTNTPVTPNGDRSTIEVSVTPPPGEGNYSYSLVEYRKASQAAWTQAPPASPESTFEVPSDGETYFVRVRAVSKSGEQSPSGPVDSITVTDRNGRTSAQLAALYPLSPITGLTVINGESANVFTGLDCAVEWSNANAETAYFNYYEIEIYNGATLLRTEKSVSPLYVYSYEKNRADYLTQNSVVGVYLTLEIRVRPVSKYRNDQNNLYAGDQALISVSATTTNNALNLRFYEHLTADDDRVNNNNATPYSLVASNASMRVTGSTIEQIGASTDWGDKSVRSVEGFQGGAFVSFRVDVQNRYLIGLSIDPGESNSYETIDYAILVYTDSVLRIYEKGVSAYSDASASVSVGDHFMVTYDGVTVRYYHNGTLVFSTTPAAQDLKLYFDSAFRDIGGKISSIQFGPFTNNDWSNVGGQDRPEDNATNGATWEDNIAGQPDRQMILNNQVDVSDWLAGASGPSGVLDTTSLFFPSANSFDVTEGPFGFDEVCWKVQAASLAEDDGGFGFRTTVKINREKVYRVSCWFKCNSASAGTFRFAPSGNSILRTLDTTAAVSKPNQFLAAAPAANKWYLIVHVIHPASTTRTSTSGKSALYDGETGEVVAFFDEYKFGSVAEYITSSFEFIDIGDTTSIAHFARPRLEVIDGSEQTMTALLGFNDSLYVQISEAPAMLHVLSSGTKQAGPGSISTSKVSTGRYRITHNSGYSGRGVIISPRSTTVAAFGVTNELSNSFDVMFYDASVAAVDSAFTLLLGPEYGT